MIQQKSTSPVKSERALITGHSKNRQQEEARQLASSSSWSDDLHRMGGAKGENSSFASSGIDHFAQISILPSSPGQLQPKLKINQPNDKYEQEADRVAAQIVGMSEQMTSGQKMGSEIGEAGKSPKIQRKCAGCEDEEEMIQRKTLDATGGAASAGLMSQIQRTQGGGQAMNTQTRSYMEPRFGLDFSNVRIHADRQAATMSQSINAQAFTVGRDIYFNQGAYQPDSQEGKTLLAHELTHVVQQQARSLPAKKTSPISLAKERAGTEMLMPKTQTIKKDFHDPNFCYQPNRPRNDKSPDRSKVVAVMQAQIKTPNTCNGEVVLKTSVLKSRWGAIAARFDAYGGGGAQLTGTKTDPAGKPPRDTESERIDFEERFALHDCHAKFSRCHLIKFKEGPNIYTFTEAGYNVNIHASGVSIEKALPDDRTPAPQLIVEPCNGIKPTLCKGIGTVT